MGNNGQRRKPRIFKWSQAARDAVRANLNASGPQLHNLITKLALESGNPRDACIRFARQIGITYKRPYRRWSEKERADLERLLELYPVRTVAMKLKRTPFQIYGELHRLGMSAKIRKESLSLYTLARLLHRLPQTVRNWIEAGWLTAENEGTQTAPRLTISHESFAKFCKERPALVTGNRLTPQRLDFLFEYMFGAKRQYTVGDKWTIH